MFYLLKKSHLILLIIMLMSAVVLAACTGESDSGADGSGGEESGEVASTAVAESEEAASMESTESGDSSEEASSESTDSEENSEAAESTEKSSITILIPENPVAFNGINTDTGYEQALGELIMLSLVEVDPNGNFIPELAAEIPTLENGGLTFDEDSWSMTATWHLRDDVYWSDGEQVTVDDVIFTYNTIAEQSWADGVDYTESIEKIDDFTMLVTYYEGYIYPNYALQFGGEDYFIYPEHYCDAEQGFYEWDCDKEPLSNGPYILTEWATNDHLTFERNPNYYEAGKPAIDQVLVRIVPEQSVRKEIMLQGDADVHYWPGDTNAEVYKETDHVDWLISPTDRWVMRMIPNLMSRGEVDVPHPFLSDVRVRQAIRRAIDVDTILNELFFGNGNPVWTEFFRAPYVCDIERPSYDPAAAAAILEEAGWTDTDGDGIRECNGCETAEDGTVMSMEFVIYAEYGESLELTQQFIAENLRAIGIGTDLLTVEGVVLWAPQEDGGLEPNGQFEMDMWDDGYPGIDPTDNLLWTYYYGYGTPEEGGWNVGRWLNEDFDALMDEAYTLDEEYRKEIFCDMAAILDEEVPQILLFSVYEQHGVAARLQGVLPSANDPLTWNVADWTLTDG